MENIESEKLNQGLISKETEDEKDFASQRLSNGLTLRKRRINAIISKRRGIDGFKVKSSEDYEINKEKLEIPKQVKDKKYEDIENFLSEMKQFILSDNIEFNKYALYCIRSQTITNESSNNRSIFSDLLYKQDFISNILNLIQKYIDNKYIVNEGLWILINILFYQKDNSNLILYLSNSQCIQLYKKILDKKDNYLRLNVYWLLTNMISNDDTNLNSKVIFHIYMSPLFRLYIFKDLEDKNSKLTEKELENLINIIALLCPLINKTILLLEKKNIKIFTDYNSDLEFDSIKENNDYLFYHSMMILINYIENTNLTTYCLFGLAELTNFLDDTVAYNKFFQTGIFRKLIKNQIKVEEKDLNFALRIIGNYLSYTPGDLLDPIILEESINYFIQLLKIYSKIQNIKCDIYWCLSNISSGNSSFGELFVKSGLISLALESICSESDKIVSEILFMLAGFFDVSNIEVIINYYNLDYIKYLTSCLKRVYNECKFEASIYWIQILDRLIYIIGFLIEAANILNPNCSNKFFFEFEKYGGFELVEAIFNEHKFPKEIENGFEKLLNLKNNN